MIVLNSLVEADQPDYTSIWERNLTDDEWYARFNLTRDQYSQEADAVIRQGMVLVEFYSYSFDDETYYGGIWSGPASGKLPSRLPDNRPPVKSPSGGGAG